MSDPTSNGGAVITEDERLADGQTPTADGVYYLENGKVLFMVDAAPYTLRGPRVGEFRRLHSDWVANMGLPPATVMDRQIAWVKVLFNGDPESDPPFLGLADHHLPDNVDEWPSWVGVPTWQAKVMIHFRDVPLARGGPGAS